MLYEWYYLAQREKKGEYNIESLDMNSMFWVAMTFMLIYRCGLGVAGAVFVLLEGCLTGADIIDEEGEDCAMSVCGWCCLVLCCCILFVVILPIFGLEFGIFIAIWWDQSTRITDASEAKSYSPGAYQKSMQLIEGVLESMPEGILQSVFIIRSANDDYLLRNEATVFGLTILSIIASICSITSKYIWIDQFMTINSAKSMFFKAPDFTDVSKTPYIRFKDAVGIKIQEILTMGWPNLPKRQYNNDDNNNNNNNNNNSNTNNRQIELYKATKVKSYLDESLANCLCQIVNDFNYDSFRNVIDFKHNFMEASETDNDKNYTLNSSGLDWFINSGTRNRSSNMHTNSESNCTDYDGSIIVAIDDKLFIKASHYGLHDLIMNQNTGEKVLDPRIYLLVLQRLKGYKLDTDTVNVLVEDPFTKSNDKSDEKTDEKAEKTMQSTNVNRTNPVNSISAQHPKINGIRIYLSPEMFEEIKHHCTKAARSELYLTIRAPCGENYLCSIGYMVRVFWRLCAVTSRFAIFSLIWVVIGGAFEIIILCTMIIVWYLMVLLYANANFSNKVSYKRCSWIGCHGLKKLFDMVEEIIKESHPCCYLCEMIAFIVGFCLIGVTFQLGILGIGGTALYAIRMIENVILMGLVSSFAFVSSIKCYYCNDFEIRSVENDRILIWIIIGWTATVGHIISSFGVNLLLRNDYQWSFDMILQELAETYAKEVKPKPENK